ncbi:N-acetylmuramoyl-L-alanine amidase-like domain-containing protein [Arundinibacter roseus]|uniref:DUF1460 domain-containing protein n=1 Tax=Arundinibacter roseus TaxID=2070510 RepID=A0A4R4KGB2_9BACT|nr:N-acetylmuramoyl-L-alanine amidase-like domain-containing protein [Arundinibacter roseus]TDB67074.1 DUF1460 domain-containing protein [Arundinibacter roseus]
MKLLIFAGGLLGLLLAQQSLAQVTQEESYSKKIQQVSSGNLPELTFQMAKTFLGTPYVAQTLEGNEKEQLICRFDGLDCTTLVEVSLALAISKQNSLNYSQFLTQLERVRYKDGRINGYGSRLHYFTSWMLEHQSKGLVRDVTKELGGVPFTKTINFMSTHADLYKGISSTELLQEISKNEQEVNQSDLYFIPKSAVRSVESILQTGDIIGITSTVAGLDCNHQGVIQIRNGRAYLLHASTTAQAVIASKEPLTDYLQSVKRHSGIIVVRPVMQATTLK